MSEKRNENYSIDDILEEAKFYQKAGNQVYRGTDKGELLSDSEWSMDDIDSLLKDIDAYRNPPEDEVIFTPEPVTDKAESINNFAYNSENDSEADEITEAGVEEFVEEANEEISYSSDDPDSAEEDYEDASSDSDTSKTIEIGTTQHLNTASLSDTGILSFGKNAPTVKPMEETEEKHEDMMYEKPGLVILTNEEDENAYEDGLDPMPTLIPAHQLVSDTREYKKVVVEEEQQEDEDGIDGQIKIVGFEGDTSNEPVKISEAKVENELKRRKAEKISRFTIYSDDEPDSGEVIPEEDEDLNLEPVVYKEADHITSSEPKKEIPLEAPEEVKTFTKKLKDFFRIEKEKVELPTPDTNDAYLTKEGKAEVLKDLTDLFAKNKKDMIILAVLTVLLLLVTVIPSNSSTGFSGVFGIISLILNILLTGAVFFFRKDCIISAFRAIKNKTFNTQIVITLAGILTVLESVFALFAKSTASLAVYSAVIAFALLLDSIGFHFKLSTVIKNFNFMNVNLLGRTYTIQTLEDKKFADSLGRGLLLGDPDIRYSARTKTPSKFIELSFDKNISDKYSEKIVPVAVILAALIGVISGIITGTVVNFFAAFCCVLCVSLPIGSVLALNVSLNLANKNLNKNGSMIAGYSAALECGRANSIVIDSASLFIRNECNFHGMKNFDNMRLDDVILYSAAMLIEADGPLAKVFRRVIMDKEELLPEVQSLSYEDKLGLSAWINNQRAFLGNREMLINHNIDVPHESAEKKYTHDGRKVLYLAVEGKLAAMFVVSYKADLSLLKPLHVLDSSGISILVRTNDANITENMLADEFGLSTNSIKILNSVAGNTFKERSNTVRRTTLAGIVHDGQSKSFLRSVASANNLTLTSNIMMTIQLVGIILGLLLSLIFVFISSLSLFGPLQLMAFMAVWTLVMTLIPIIKK